MSTLNTQINPAIVLSFIEAYFITRIGKWGKNPQQLLIEASKSTAGKKVKACQLLINQISTAQNNLDWIKVLQALHSLEQAEIKKHKETWYGLYQMLRPSPLIGQICHAGISYICSKLADSQEFKAFQQDLVKRIKELEQSIADETKHNLLDDIPRKEEALAETKALHEATQVTKEFMEVHYQSNLKKSYKDLFTEDNIEAYINNVLNGTHPNTYCTMLRSDEKHPNLELVTPEKITQETRPQSTWAAVSQAQKQNNISVTPKETEKEIEADSINEMDNGFGKKQHAEKIERDKKYKHKKQAELLTPNSIYKPAPLPLISPPPYNLRSRYKKPLI